MQDGAVYRVRGFLLPRILHTQENLNNLQETPPSDIHFQSEYTIKSFCFLTKFPLSSYENPLHHSLPFFASTMCAH